jgi:hypothetical protein
MAAMPALAGDLVLTADDSAAEMRLMTSACVNPSTLTMLRHEWRERFKAAHVTIGARAYAGCWIDDEGVAVILFENGEQVQIELAAFRSAAI